MPETPKTVSTAQAAKAVGISRRTLERWIRDNVFEPPVLLDVFGISMRRWTAEDVARLRALKQKLMNQEGRSGPRFKKGGHHAS